MGVPTSRRRFWAETVLAAAAAVFALLTAVWKDWIEIVFRVDPDRHSGSLEWATVAAFALASVAFAVAARVEWRRTHARPAG